MDFANLNADKNLILSKHFSKGRSGRKVEFIGVHYEAGDLSLETVYNVWQTREASAHYAVESGGRIGQFVHDWDTGWALGNWDANCKSINIEHANKADGTITEACLDNGAHLVAALCKHFGLGRPQWLVNVFPHKHFSSTSCPGQIYGSQKDTYIQRAQMWYDKMMGGQGGTSTPTPQPPAQPSAPSGSVDVDGYWGTATTKLAQSQAGTPVDGEVSSQSAVWRSNAGGCTFGWEWVNNPEGSQLIVKIQTTLRDKYGQDVGTVDGLYGPKFWKAMERAAGYVADDLGFEGPSNTIKWFQRKLNEGTFF